MILTYNVNNKDKGKKLKGFTIDGTRPTMDRVKESLFGMIQNYIKDKLMKNLQNLFVFNIYLF